MYMILLRPIGSIGSLCVTMLGRGKREIHSILVDGLIFCENITRQLGAGNVFKVFHFRVFTYRPRAQYYSIHIYHTSD